MIAISKRFCAIADFSKSPDFSGLDRVLLWLLRLLNAKEGGGVSTQVGTQVTRLALQLARLIGSPAAATTSRQPPRRSSSSSSSSTGGAVGNLAELTWDDLVVLLAADVRSVLGEIDEVCTLPHWV